jgi:hypothetical protein
MKGGNSDELYKGNGRFQMAKELFEVWPHLVDITWRYQKPQHHINYRQFTQRLKFKPEVDLSKLNRRFYFFDEDENRQLIDIFKNDFGEYIKIFDIEVTRDRFKLKTLWRSDEFSGNICRDFEVTVIKNNTFNQIYDFLVQKEISDKRILKLRDIGI